MSSTSTGPAWLPISDGDESGIAQTCGVVYSASGLANIVIINAVPNWFYYVVAQW